MTHFKKSISDKLKGIFTDSLSEEERMTRHFIAHATCLAKISSHKDAISLHILEKDGKISAVLNKGDTLIRDISLDEIALFFTNSFTASLIGKSIVEEKLKKYFKTFNAISGSKPIGVRMIILKEEQVRIFTFGTQCASEVLLSEFITFFKS